MGILAPFWSLCSALLTVSENPLLQVLHQSLIELQEEERQGSQGSAQQPGGGMQVAEIIEAEEVTPSTPTSSAVAPSPSPSDSAASSASEADASSSSRSSSRSSSKSGSGKSRRRDEAEEEAEEEASKGGLRPSALPKPTVISGAAGKEGPGAKRSWGAWGSNRRIKEAGVTLLGGKAGEAGQSAGSSKEEEEVAGKGAAAAGGARGGGGGGGKESRAEEVKAGEGGAGEEEWEVDEDGDRVLVVNKRAGE